MNQLNLKGLRNKTGAQSWKFKPGQHTVAVKVVDNDGLENVEVLRVGAYGFVTWNYEMSSKIKCTN